MGKAIVATFGIFGLLAFIVLMIVFGPFVTMWSLNTLFGLGIAYTFKTWLATCWIQMVTFGGINAAINKKKD